jgi:hypothetical protein
MAAKFSMLHYFLFLFPIICYAAPAQLPKKTSYNEEEARKLLNLAAGAYSTAPQECLSRYKILRLGSGEKKFYRTIEKT